MYASECFKLDKRTYRSIPCLRHALEGNLQGFVKVAETSGSEAPNSVVNYTYSKSGDTPLILAAKYGHEDLLLYILKNGGDLEHRNNNGKRALHEAAHSGSHECVEALLEAGAQVDVLKRADCCGHMISFNKPFKMAINNWKNLGTPLMLACTKDNQETVQLLLEAGADPSRTNKDGWNCFQIAVRSRMVLLFTVRGASKEGHKRILETLLSWKHDIWNTKSKNGRTPLHTAAMHGQTNTVKFILERCKYPPNAKDSCGSTPLMDAVKLGHIEISDLLIKNHNAEITMEDSLGRQCIHLAAFAGNMASVMYLVENYQMDINVKTSANQSTPLHFAAKEGHLEVLKYLVSLNADLKAVDRHGRTVLHLASGGAHTEVVRTLLKDYHLSDTQDYHGVTAYDMALKHEIKELFETVPKSHSWKYDR